MNLEPLACAPSRRRGLRSCGALALLCVAFASGCGFAHPGGEDSPLEKIVTEGQKSSVWKDAKGASPTREEETEAKWKCENEIRYARTDQVYSVTAAQLDECLKSKGWTKIPQPPEPKKK